MKEDSTKGVKAGRKGIKNFQFFFTARAVVRWPDRTTARAVHVRSCAASLTPSFSTLPSTIPPHSSSMTHSTLLFQHTLLLLLFIIRGKRELKRVHRNRCRYNERLNSETGGSKTPQVHKKRRRLKTTVNKITHHVPPRQMVCTKKQIG